MKEEENNFQILSAPYDISSKYITSKGLLKTEGIWVTAFSWYLLLVTFQLGGCLIFLKQNRLFHFFHFSFCFFFLISQHPSNSSWSHQESIGCLVRKKKTWNLVLEKINIIQKPEENVGRFGELIHLLKGSFFPTRSIWAALGNISSEALMGF